MQAPRFRCQSKCVQIKHAVTLWLFNVAMDIFPVHMGKSTASGPLSSSKKLLTFNGGFDQQKMGQ